MVQRRPSRSEGLGCTGTMGWRVVAKVEMASDPPPELCRPAFVTHLVCVNGKTSPTGNRWNGRMFVAVTAPEAWKDVPSADAEFDWYAIVADTADDREEAAAYFFRDAEAMPGTLYAELLAHARGLELPHDPAQRSMLEYVAICIDD